MKIWMAPIRSGTLVNEPRRIACRVMIPKKISTMFIHEAPVGVKCIVTPGGHRCVGRPVDQGRLDQ
jgi:hypothetical protein